MSTFGYRFKTLRKEKDLTQRELVEDFNRKYNYDFNRPAISNYEHNRRIPETEALKAFADYFNVSVDYLLGISDNRTDTGTRDKNYKVIKAIVERLNLEGYEINENDIPLVLKAIKFALDVK